MSIKWLYIDFNSYFASVEQQLDPRLRGRPVAVIPVETESTSAIAASYEAKAFGIRTGTPVWEARQKCPGLICVLGRHDKYVEYHHKILDEIDNHIPVTKVCSIDEMACQLLRNEQSRERATEIANAIKAGLRKNVGEFVKCSIGFAPNKYLAKVATDLKKPDGMTFLMPEDLPHRLYDLTLRDLPGIGHNMEQRLHRAGIYDVRKLMTLQPKHMRAVWGSIWGEKMYYLLRGVELPEEETTRSSVGHSHVLSPEMRPPAEARQVARRLVMKAAMRLRRMEYKAGAMSLGLRIENGPRIGLEARVDAADDSFTFLSMLDQMWDELSPEMKGKRIKKVSVTFFGLDNGAAAAQGDLFAPLAPPEDLATRDRNAKISRAIDKLNYKFGKDTVSVGIIPKHSRTFTGTKVAFTRIPDMAEFLE